MIDTPAYGVWSERPFPVDERLARRTRRGAARRPGLARGVARRRPVGRRRQLDALLAAEPELTPHEVAGAVARALPAGGLLVVGASSPIRDLDLMVPRYEVGARRKVIANRGLSGIDGTVSTAIGAALGRPDSSRALALMGDVTFLHDANGLVIGPDEPVPDLTIVVVNDDGGSIFSMLEQGARASTPTQYERLFGTPHRRRPRQPLRGDPHAALRVDQPARARAGAGQPERRHRGRRGRRTARQPARARRPDPGAAALTDRRSVRMTPWRSRCSWCPSPSRCSSASWWRAGSGCPRRCCWSSPEPRRRSSRSCRRSTSSPRWCCSGCCRRCSTRPRISSSLVDFNANRRPILLLSVGLVLFTTAGVGWVVHEMIPGLSWPIAFALGAVVAPPDAVAATAIGRHIGLPRQIVTILEGESLFNDATALVALRTALGAAWSAVELWEVGVDFVVAAGGGVLIGFGGFLLVARMRRRITDPVLDVGLSLRDPVRVLRRSPRRSTRPA